MKLPPTHTLRYDSFRLTDVQVDETVISIETPLEERGRIDAWNDLRRSDADRLILLSRLLKYSPTCGLPPLALALFFRQVSVS